MEASLPLPFDELLATITTKASRTLSKIKLNELTGIDTQWVINGIGFRMLLFALIANLSDDIEIEVLPQSLEDSNYQYHDLLVTFNHEQYLILSLKYIRISFLEGLYQKDLSYTQFANKMETGMNEISIESDDSIMTRLHQEKKSNNRMNKTNDTYKYTPISTTMKKIEKHAKQQAFRILHDSNLCVFNGVKKIDPQTITIYRATLLGLGKKIITSSLLCHKTSKTANKLLPLAYIYNEPKTYVIKSPLYTIDCSQETNDEDIITHLYETLSGMKKLSSCYNAIFYRKFSTIEDRDINDRIEFWFFKLDRYV